MNEHGHSASLNKRVCFVISYRNALYNIYKKQVISWCPYPNCDSFHSMGFQTVRQLWVAKAIPCLKAIHLPLHALEVGVSSPVVDKSSSTKVGKDIIDLNRSPSIFTSNVPFWFSIRLFVMDNPSPLP